MPLTKDAWPSKEGLKIGYLNVNSARNKMHEMSSILHNSGKHFHLFCFAESRLTEDNEVDIDGYDSIPLHAKAIREVGLILYCSKSITFKRLFADNTWGIESVWVEISIKRSTPLILGFVYRNPAEKVEWYDRFNSLMDAVILESKETIIMGDFNINLLSPSSKWSHIYPMYGLEQLVDRRTRITDKTKTLIDHIYVTSTKKYHRSMLSHNWM